MNRYSEESKEAILRQMMVPEDKLVFEMARENGILKQTFHHRRKNFHAKGMPVPRERQGCFMKLQRNLMSSNVAAVSCPVELRVRCHCRRHRTGHA